MILSPSPSKETNLSDVKLTIPLGIFKKVATKSEPQKAFGSLKLSLFMMLTSKYY